jgi:aryl-alcohol dehydrogenase
MGRRKNSNRNSGAGIVVKTGSKVDKTSVGDHVVLTYTCCGECKHCKNHDTSFCYNWERDNFGVGRPDGSKSYSTREGGVITSHFFGQSSFAKHAVVNQNCVVKVDEDMPLKLLAPLGCGIMTGAGGEPTLQR